VVFESADGLLGCIVTVGVGWDQLIVNILSSEEGLEGTGCFIVEALELGAETCVAEAGMEALVGSEDVLGLTAF